MFIDININVNGEDLEAMRKRCVQLVLEAEAARGAYKKFLLEFWEKWLKEQVGKRPSESKPVEATIQTDEGMKYVRVMGVRLNYFDEVPHVKFVEKNKSGRWGKTVYLIDLPCDIRAIE